MRDNPLLHCSKRNKNSTLNTNNCCNKRIILSVSIWFACSRKGKLQACFTRPRTASLRTLLLDSSVRRGTVQRHNAYAVRRKPNAHYTLHHCWIQCNNITDNDFSLRLDAHKVIASDAIVLLGCWRRSNEDNFIFWLSEKKLKGANALNVPIADVFTTIYCITTVDVTPWKMTENDMSFTDGLLARGSFYAALVLLTEPYLENYVS